jgi:hypothetical protein
LLIGLLERDDREKPFEDRELRFPYMLRRSLKRERRVERDMNEFEHVVRASAHLFRTEVGVDDEYLDVLHATAVFESTANCEEIIRKKRIPIALTVCKLIQWMETCLLEHFAACLFKLSA